MRLDVAATAATTALIILCALGSGCTASASARASITPPAGCSPDDSLVCPAGGDGWTCAAGDNPELEEPGLSCSVPRADGPNDDFCCFAWTFGTTTCTPDDEITSVCAFPSYGYRCAAGDDPTSLDSSLSCSPPTPDGSSDDFCCT
jgi:hypothetical protein